MDGENNKRKQRVGRRRKAAAGEEAPAPALREALLARMDQEYRSYRQAVLQALNTVEDLTRMDLASLRDDLAEVRTRLAALESRLADAPPAAPVAAITRQGACTPGIQIGGASVAGGIAAGTPGTAPAAIKRRIKWGSNPDTVRNTVYAQLAAMVDDPDHVSTELIKQRIPSMLRWLYGERAVFKGIEGLRSDFREYWFGRSAAAGTGPQPLAEAAAGASEKAMVSTGSA